jgi:SsrA-binding protein
MCPTLRPVAGPVKESKTTKEAKAEKLIVKNRRASFDYALEDSFEGGLALLGSEVKSLRAGKCEIVDAFAAIEGGDVWLKQLRIPPLPEAAAYPHDPKRPRRVLLHRSEIERIDKSLSREGFTLVPVRLYFRGGKVKVELALGKGKKTFDKRHDIAKKTADREARIAISRRSDR